MQTSCSTCAANVEGKRYPCTHCFAVNCPACYQLYGLNCPDHQRGSRNRKVGTLTPVSVASVISDVESAVDEDLLIVGSAKIPSLDISDVISAVDVDVGDDAVDDDAVDDGASEPVSLASAWSNAVDVGAVDDDAVDDGAVDDGASEPVSSASAWSNVVDVGAVDDDAVDDGASEPVSSALRPITLSSEVLVSTHVAKDTSTSDDEVIDLNIRGTQDFFRATALASDDSYLVIPNSEVFCCYIFNY
jgi:hypothetical protein